METSYAAVSRWQFDLVWALFEFHLERLEPADFLWEPTDLCWTLRRDGSGAWQPDWADTEPDPIPVPTIGWLSWHIGWWWTVTIDHLAGQRAHERTEIAWPGPESAVEWLRELRTRYLTALENADLTAPAAFPWPDDPEKTVAHTVAWAHAELMKNAAEIGQLRLLRAASSQSSQES
ncbi:DinB family protein [Nocardia sp. NPDC127579]|uniref:DinB family protein n=1 Tax=Nocardia sp. NPDC127579 TaxID=3345402 RepID=UPI003632A00B